MMYSTNPQQAVSQLEEEFERVPRRIIDEIFFSYLDRVESVRTAAQATRMRLIDACRAS